MGAKRAGGHDNGHTARSFGNPIGVEYEGCGRRALVPLDRLGNLDGDRRPLWGRPFKCSACGFLDVVIVAVAKRTEADAWSEESGPGF